MDLTETVTGTREIFKGRVVHLRVDTVQLPNGSTSQREIIAHPGAVCMVPVNEDGEVLMVRQFRLAAGKALLEIPAGTLEKDEVPIDCAARELEEETGFRAASIRPMFSAYLAPGYSSELIHAFLATGLSKLAAPAAQDSDENVRLEAIPLGELQRMVLRGDLQDSKSISSILTAIKLLEADANTALGSGS